MAEFYVYDNEEGDVGKCYYTHRHGQVSSVFSYSHEYLAKPSAYNIDPALQMVEGSQFTGGSALPRAFMDTAPDRWGRNLIYKRHIQESRLSGTAVRELSDVDYLLGVSDSTRTGSLRYKVSRTDAFVHESKDIPKLISLPKLLDSTRALAGGDSHEAVKYLLDVGTASLGGARPKATVSDEGVLYIAKFPHVSDKWDVISWEYVALVVARAAGIDTPDFKMLDVGGSNVLLLKRFDRTNAGDVRIGYISAMTLLGIADGQKADYSDLCLQMGDVCIEYRNDLKELFKRILLSVLINNTDDHLRNHGFLRFGTGWKLSPVFDINPDPNLYATRATSIYGEAFGEAQLHMLQKNCADFMLDSIEAASALKDVKSAVSSWRDVATRVGIAKPEIDGMSGAMDFYC
jgi:serine/threonine-protein kinase HipA